MEDVVTTYICVKEYVQREFLGNKVTALVPNKVYKSVNGIVRDERGNQQFADVLVDKGYLTEFKNGKPETMYYYVMMKNDGSRGFIVKDAFWGHDAADDHCRLTNGNIFLRKEDAEAHAAYLNSNTRNIIETDAESKEDVREDELADAAE